MQPWKAHLPPCCTPDLKAIVLLTRCQIVSNFPGLVQPYQQGMCCVLKWRDTLRGLLQVRVRLFPFLRDTLWLPWHWQFEQDWGFGVFTHHSCRTSEVSPGLPLYQSKQWTQVVFPASLLFNKIGAHFPEGEINKHGGGGCIAMYYCDWGSQSHTHNCMCKALYACSNQHARVGREPTVEMPFHLCTFISLYISIRKGPLLLPRASKKQLTHQLIHSSLARQSQEWQRGLLSPLSEGPRHGLRHCLHSSKHHTK